MKYRLFCFVLLGAAMIFFVGLGDTAAVSLSDPMSQVKATVEEVMTILNDDRLGRGECWEEKKALIRVVVNNRFDFEEMSKRALAQNWKQRTGDEKKDFVEKFSQLLERTYINRVEDYADAEVFFQKQKVQADKAVVYSVINSNQKAVPVTYKMLLKGDRWLVYDVIIEGVSLVRNYRSQFSEIISREKYAGLIRRVEEKIDDKVQPRAGE